MASQGAYSIARSFRVVRSLLVLLLGFSAFLAGASDSYAANVPRAYAGIVIDAKSGKVLYEHAADAPRYPASVTKVMTLYILFQELAAGRVTLETKFNVSKHAAAASPTKLGIGSGRTISVEDCIKAIVTISANDIARVIAENIAGSESKFAERMTRTARALGMTHTTYRNASGLPDSGQITTVRDQAILGVAVYQHFPRYYDYFQTTAFRFGKRTYGNHNRLLGNNGVDGIKTGYIRASGYNLLTAARKDGRHIVVAGFGFDSAGGRDSKVRELVRTYLPKARKGDYLQTAMIPAPGAQGTGISAAPRDEVQVASASPVEPMPFPSFRLETSTALPPAALDVAAAAPVAVAELEEVPAPAAVTEDAQAVAAVEVAPKANVAVAELEAPIPAEPMNIGIQPALAAANELGRETAIAPVPAYPSDDIIGAWISEQLSLGAAPTELGQTRASAPLVPPVGVGEAGQAVDLMNSGSIAVASLAEPVSSLPRPVHVDLPPPAGAWVIQVGAAQSAEAANDLLIQAASAVANLGVYQPFIERVQKDGQMTFRARFAGFGGRDDATTICSQLKHANKSCLAMQS